MSITVYGIPNCDSCRAARKWLDARDVAYTFHDVRADGLSAKRVQAWRQAGAGENLVNRRSRTWRELDEATRARADSHPEPLLAEIPLLLKRPLLDTGETVIVGFNAKDWARALGVKA